MSPRLLAIEADRALRPHQRVVLSILAGVEEFFADAGVPLTAEQVAALRGAEQQALSP